MARVAAAAVAAPIGAPLRVLAVLTLSLALTAGAQTPLATGDVLVLEPSGWFDFYYPPAVTVLDATGSVKSTLPRTLPFDNTLLVQAPDRLWSSDENGGVLLSRDGATLAGRFLTSLRLHRLSGIAPLRSGNLVVAESWGSLLPSFVELTPSGDLVAVHALPSTYGLQGIAGFEPLADSCGIAWTMYGSHTVRVFDICENRPRPDLFTIPEADGLPYLVRQLPGGEFLITTDHRVLRVTANGAPVATYGVAVSLLALTPDGTGFWWIDSRDSTLRRLDFAAPNEVFRLKSSFHATGLTVAGEWRASLQPLASAPLAQGDVVLQVWSGTCCSISRLVFDENGIQKPGYPVIPEIAPEIAPDDFAQLRLKTWTVTEAARLRSGEFLVSEHETFFPRLMKFDAAGHIVSVYDLPYEPYVYGAWHLEAFADQCTVAWTSVSTPDAGMYSNPLRPLAIRAFDICRNEALPDLLQLPAGSKRPEDLRQLANGDWLVVTSHEVVQFQPSGKVVASWPMITSGVALTHDGRGFWALEHNGFGGASRLVRIDFDQPRVRRVDQAIDQHASLELVAGEWYAAVQPAPPQPPSRRRSVRR